MGRLYLVRGGGAGVCFSPRSHRQGSLGRHTLYMNVFVRDSPRQSARPVVWLSVVPWHVAQPKNSGSISLPAPLCLKKSYPQWHQFLSLLCSQTPPMAVFLFLNFAYSLS